MELKLYRTIFTDFSTIGVLFIGTECVGNTLEDTSRRDLNQNDIFDKEDKVPGHTAIPSGRYTVLFEWSPKYKRKMPFLFGRKVGRNNASNLFNDVMIHWGNSPSNTEGCILVGQYDASIPNWITHSRVTFDRLVDRLITGDKPIHLHIMGGLKLEALVA